MRGKFGAGGKEGEAGGCDPGEGGGGDGEDVVAVGGDGRQEVRGGGGCNIGEQSGEQGAGELVELEVGKRDQALAMEKDGERCGLDEDADVGGDGQAA